jgi:hypothetical protein
MGARQWQNMHKIPLDRSGCATLSELQADAPLIGAQPADRSTCLHRNAASLR